MARAPSEAQGRFYIWRWPTDEEEQQEKVDDMMVMHSVGCGVRNKVHEDKVEILQSHDIIIRKRVHASTLAGDRI